MERSLDRIPNNETYYTKNIIKFELKKENLVDKTPTIFIKLNKASKNQKKLDLVMFMN